MSSWSEIASKTKKIELVPKEELDEIYRRVQTLTVSSDIAETVSADPIKNSKEIPYYRNSKRGVYSVFTDPPGPLRALQDVNILMISESEARQLTRIDYPLWSKDSTSSVKKVGDAGPLAKLAAEIAFILRFNRDIDYTTSSFKGFSQGLKWILRKIQSAKLKSSQRVDLELTSKDHTDL
jgi:hypothetical protein